MTDTGGDKDGVPRGDANHLAMLPAEQHLRLAAGDAEHLMRGRMIVVKGEYPVPPASAPAMRREKPLECGSRVFLRGPDRTSIDDQRNAVVRDVAVVREVERFGFHGEDALVFPLRCSLTACHAPVKRGAGSGAGDATKFALHGRGLVHDDPPLWHDATALFLPPPPMIAR